MRTAALAVHQFHYDQKVFWRNPASVFFTVMFPVLFMVLFNLIFDSEIDQLGVSTTTYYVPAIITLAVVGATTQNLAMNLTSDREAGLLKRVRGTPLPSVSFVAGRVGNSLVLSVMMVAVVAGLGSLAYGVELPTETVPGILITLAVGAFAFSCIGFALTTIIPSEEAAPAITNAVILPLYFISGVFIPESEIPDGVLDFADHFPIRHFFEAFFTAWDPATTGTGIAWGDLAVVAVWGVAALAIAVWRFRWEPRR